MAEERIAERFTAIRNLLLKCSEYTSEPDGFINTDIEFLFVPILGIGPFVADQNIVRFVRNFK